ncbi:MAG: PD-(D/E)XK nuclease family protein, partial [Pseudomonadota bacterium]
QGEQVFGRVDLLQERVDGVHLVDFKSNRVVPDRPEDIPSAILAQLALYRAVLTPSLDGVALHLSVLWTSPARLMPVPHAILDEVTPRPLPPA